MDKETLIKIAEDLEEIRKLNDAREYIQLSLSR